MDKLSQISYRLSLLREREGLSLRAFVEAVEDRTGFRVGHDSARRYETDQTRVPAEWVVEVCRAFGVSAEWLLFGEGPIERPPTLAVERAFDAVAEIVHRVRGLRSAAPNRRMLELVRSEWEYFIQGLPPRHHLRDAIVESWDRSRTAGVSADAGEITLHRVPRDELDRRRRRHRPLIEVARRHLGWLSVTVNDLPHVAYLVSPDGIVLDSVSSEPELLEHWGLKPGHDWSEDRMGTNGAGTALASGNVTAVIGPEHYVRSVQGCTCLAAPVRDGRGKVLGAIDLSTSFAGWGPQRLVFVAYAAAMIEKELKRDLSDLADRRIGDGPRASDRGGPAMS